MEAAVVAGGQRAGERTTFKFGQSGSGFTADHNTNDGHNNCFLPDLISRVIPR